MISKQRGVGLIEVLMSLLVMSVAVLGLIKMQAYMEVRSENALHTLDALHFAEEKMELFRTRAQSAAGGTIAYDSITNGQDEVKLGSKTATRTVTVKDNIPAVGMKKVEVKVAWKDRRQATQAVKLETIISQYSEFD
ncbi:hypothetical protein A3K86_11750 [Photobacterium jeanii]|uniref:Type IV pilin n=1 Tax=Photobacterium jeanii TaxID=858640 RepID=A0A178KBA7_9GAMM|nr:prepilin-type N-terminal cleavage/methylation domain-containing protein [Photobacterium jeanii]OAN14245.1 hypothetical protein A3K86_11750 [Photobacterium jeanii]PST89766.1 hypothetical protein C9I91_12365 [Photobacterium jeanii]